MKLVINYDFFNEVLNANENITPFKVIRNNKSKWIRCHIPIAGIIHFSLNPPMKALLLLGFQFSLMTGIELVARNMLPYDPYKEEALQRLRKLSEDFNDLDIDTSCELLLKTEMEAHIYNLRLNEDKLPIIMENKYLLVPVYNNLGDVKKISVLQEHVVGSKQYVLSMGRPKKKLKFAYNHA